MRCGCVFVGNGQLRQLKAESIVLSGQKKIVLIDCIQKYVKGVGKSWIR